MTYWDIVVGVVHVVSVVSYRDRQDRMGMCLRTCELCRCQASIGPKVVGTAG